MNDLQIDKNYKIGHKGKKVKLIQELLCLYGFSIAIDKDFGPATDQAVRHLQKKENLLVDGVVEKNTFNRLIKPITDALRPINTNGQTLGGLVVAYAKQHLEHHPREIGGQNKGPWVRLYMKGHEGQDWPWCAGFVCFILKQACDTLNISLPIISSFSCDSLAASAKLKNRFLKESIINNKEQISSGSFFLQRRTSSDWVHTGIVLQTYENYFDTIEGNTNDNGYREGYEVCQRIRGYRKKDFIII